MKLLARLQKILIECGGGLLLPLHFVSAWTAILVHMSFAGPGFHRGGGRLGERFTSQPFLWAYISRLLIVPEDTYGKIEAPTVTKYSHTPTTNLGVHDRF